MIKYMKYKIINIIENININRKSTELFELKISIF